MTACPALLIVDGKFYPCDWPTNQDGTHPGWLHSNKAKATLWTDDPDKAGTLHGPCQPGCPICTAEPVEPMRDNGHGGDEADRDAVQSVTRISRVILDLLRD